MVGRVTYIFTTYIRMPHDTRYEVPAFCVSRAEQQEQHCIVQQCRAATEVGSPDNRSTGSPSRPMQRSTTQASSGNLGGSGNGSRSD